MHGSTSEPKLRSNHSVVSSNESVVDQDPMPFLGRISSAGRCRVHGLRKIVTVWLFEIVTGKGHPFQKANCYEKLQTYFGYPTMFCLSLPDHQQIALVTAAEETLDT
jgi:hypothetical protein